MGITSSSADKIREQLKGYGVAPENVRIFGQAKPGPEVQDYLTLDALRRANRPAPDGVAECQGRPVLYFIQEQSLVRPGGRAAPSEPDTNTIPTVFRQLVCRGERAYLARIEFGRLLVAPVSAKRKEPHWEQYTPDSIAGRCLFSRLTMGTAAHQEFAAGDLVFQRLFALVKHAANEIAATDQLRADSLSLVGRALFFRFLRDRGVLDDYPVARIAPGARDWSECFANARHASNTCAWLDNTFNGDFLPLSGGGSERFFRRVGNLTKGHLFRHLSAVIRGHDPLGGDYQPLLSWNWQQFDFAQIPVGLLSQVYEAFCWEWTPEAARRTSQRYTPRNIAATLVNEVFDALPNVTRCRVLDPACGAGVFLVLAFRRLYKEQWKAAGGRRPGTAEIRKLLEGQIVGLDTSEPALRLAALSLYLTAIELDPEPKPPDKLRFSNLRGHVLHDVRDPGPRRNHPAIGSLGAELDPILEGKFDVVVSNPPWTSVSEQLGKQMEAVCRDAIQRIDPLRGRTYRLPDNNPDLPFVWKATKWCRSGGRIAMALPARILLKTEPLPVGARSTLFELLRVDGIISGVNLADTAVWPQMGQPWILLFATNERPHAQPSMHFVTIPLDLALNTVGDFHIDSKSARRVDLSLAINRPWLWKALSVGTMLDVDVVDKLLSAGGEAIEEYWKRVIGPYSHGKGYTRGKPEQRIRDASHLKNLPDLNATDRFRFVVEADDLSKFGYDKVQWPRRPSIYAPPLVLVKESPGEQRSLGRGLLCDQRIAYNESFSGYSAAGHSDGELLTKYVHLFIHSNLWLYYVLMTSPQFGAERRRFHKADLERCPIIPFEKLTEAQREEVGRLSDCLVGAADIPWSAIDSFFTRLYGLTQHDLEVVRDTLAVALPYASSGYLLPSKLEAAVAARRETLNPVGSVELCSESCGSCYGQRTHITVHRRDFTYLGTSQRAPEITLRHVWLNRG